MLSGKLRHKIKLQSKTATVNSFGEEVIVWVDKIQTWGSINPISGREYFLAKQVQAETTHKIIIRYYSGIRADWRILFGVRIFEIESIIDPEERHKELILMCREQIT